MMHRYLMTRLSFQVFYLWRHVSSTAPPLILWWPNLEILFGPSPPLHCQVIQTEHGPYIAERTQKAVYIVWCLWYDGIACLYIMYCGHIIVAGLFYSALLVLVLYYRCCKWVWGRIFSPLLVLVAGPGKGGCNYDYSPAGLRCPPPSPLLFRLYCEFHIRLWSKPPGAIPPEPFLLPPSIA
jgi:hypothetical protein